MSIRFVSVPHISGHDYVERIDDGPSDTERPPAPPSMPPPAPSSARMLAAVALERADDVIARAERMRGALPRFA